MKNYFYLLLFFVGTAAYTQPSCQNETNELGIGIISIQKAYKENRITLFKDKELKTVLNVFIINKPEKKMYPMFYKADKGICYFVCIEKSDLYSKILINKTDEAYIASDTSFIFKSWDVVLKESTGIKRPDKQNLFRSEPSDMGAIVNLIHKEEIYKVKEVKGEWIKVLNEKKQRDAWLRWRRKDKILIEVLFLD
jgi:hypothetical protein